MDLSNKQINLKNIFFSTLPGLISIVLTLISLPIYLKFLSPSYYSSFLISHIFMSLSLVFNFNIGKVASIKIQNKTKINKNKIIINAIYLSFIISVLVSFVAVFFLSFIFNNENEINFKLIFLGLVISILFINAEAILKGLGKFKIVAFTNLIFYGISISGPSFLIFFLNYNSTNYSFNLFTISIICKIISLIIIIFFIKVDFFTNNKINKKIVFSFKNQSLWMTLSNTYNQIFDYMDKYLIKLFLSPVIFINYTISQQIASKLSIFSNAITSVLLPKLAKEKKNINKTKVLNLHLYLFYISFSIFLILFETLFDELLFWWLETSFNDDLYNLFNVFLALTFIACQSHIIISLYEANEITKKNSIFESIIILPFIILLFKLINLNSVILICYLILAKELILLIIRSYFVKNFILFFNLYIFSVIFFIFLWSLKGFVFGNIVIILKIIFLLLISALFYLIFEKYNKSLK